MRISYFALWLGKDILPNPANIYLLKVNNRNTRIKPGICSKLTIKIPEIRQFGRSGLFIIYFEYFIPFPCLPIVDFEQINICWKNYLTVYSFDICFNVFTGAGQDLARSNAGNSVIFLVSHAHWDVTLASLRLLNN